MIKSQAVSAPAGSGKTEQLAQRYIELLKAGCAPERILTITFTRQAAAEMKERILRRLREQGERKLYDYVRSQMLRLRISTIDAFCLTLVRRFADWFGLEPQPDVLEDASELWYDTLNDTLTEIAEQGVSHPDYELLLQLVVSEGIAGWSALLKTLDEFFAQRASLQRAELRYPGWEQVQQQAAWLRAQPEGKEKIAGYLELFPEQPDPGQLAQVVAALDRESHKFSTQEGTARKARGQPALQEWYDRMTEYWRTLKLYQFAQAFLPRFRLYQLVMQEFRKRKRELGRVDFNDLELFAYQLLTEHENWSNILLSFDEHTDHILVDEFQDTSFLQWAIIRKLIEDWLAGEGRKRAQGIEPTIFIVGDDKQSIYRFRNAHAEIFTFASQELQTWLAPERFETIQVTDNYRSLESIIRFTNQVFSQLMAPASDEPAWKTRYGEFRTCRDTPDEGQVELILGQSEQSPIEHRRAMEADLIARRILKLVGQKTVYERFCSRFCSYRDIAIILRMTTHLGIYEKALAQYGIPFFVQRGKGFLEEREVQLLYFLLRAVVDPNDDLALYSLLRSPCFGVPERELFFASAAPGESLAEKLSRTAEGTLALSQADAALKCIKEAARQVQRRPLAKIIQDILLVQESWRLFWEPQRQANARKFLQLVDELENQGLSPLRICRRIARWAEQESDVSKAQIDNQGRDEVQIMTIHAAKGLQFPIVFVPALDQGIQPRGKDSRMLIEEITPEEVQVTWLPDSRLRKLDEAFIKDQEQEKEEAKRLFYVAVTRARDALFLSAITKKGIPERNTWLGLIWDILGLKFENETFSTKAELPGFRVVNASELKKDQAVMAEIRAAPYPQPEYQLLLEPLAVPQGCEVRTVARDTPGDRRRWRERVDELTAFGSVMHRVLEAIAKAELDIRDTSLLSSFARRCFLLEGVAGNKIIEGTAELLRQLQLLGEQNLLGIIYPQPESYAELPFMLRTGNTIYHGRIDRLILSPEEVRVYDYKTFPVRHQDLDELVSEYHQQMGIYLAAASKLFPGRKVVGYLLFTALPRLVAL